MSSGADTWNVTVVGAGSWGTALALHAHRCGHGVTLWARRRELAGEISETRENPIYLPGHVLPADLRVTSDADAALADAECVISVVPSRYLRATWQRLGESFPPGAHLVSATKGIESDSGLRMSEVLHDCVGDTATSVSALSGPSFALELAEGHPTAITLGCEDPQACRSIQVQLTHGALRVYRNEDIVGVELGGAVKNIIALAAGIVDGLGLGTNSRAALITRGLKEMARLAEARGARPATLMGLAGLGDLVLTCTGPLSRNRQVGLKLAAGMRLDEIEAEMQMVAEGVETARAARQLATAAGLEMPITEQVHAVLYEGRDPRSAIDELMARALVQE
jgi:glycerol-3-phosphate dehydrogenase (NAD(P)+)